MNNEGVIKVNFVKKKFMRRLKTKYNNEVRSILSKQIREKGRLFFNKVIGFGIILKKIDFLNK